AMCTTMLIVSMQPPAPVLYPLSLHDALPICSQGFEGGPARRFSQAEGVGDGDGDEGGIGDWRQFDEPDALREGGEEVGGEGEGRSEEHTSELQSLRHLVCRLLLEKKKTRQ